MIRRKQWRATALLALLPLLGGGLPSPGDREAAGDISAARLEAHLLFLAADFTRGRETGSEGYEIAAEYAAALFKTWGLQPGGDLPDPLVRIRTGRGRSYFQTVPLVRNAGDSETTMILTTVRGGFRKETVFRRRTDFEVDATVPFDIAAELVFAGYGSTDPDFNEIGNLNLRDKFAVILDGLPGQTNPGGALYQKTLAARETRMDRYKKAVESGEAGGVDEDEPRRRFLRALRDTGAAGCLVVSLPADEVLASSPPPVTAAWNVNAPFRNLPSNALKMYEGDRPATARKRLRLPGGPIIAPAGASELFSDPNDPILITISPETAEALFAPAGQTPDGLRRRIDSTGRPVSFPMAGVSLRIRNDVKTEVINGKNVIGVLPGSDPILNKEVVVVGAHLDHIGAYNNAIFNGADDNASGAADALELARAFSRLPVPPKRTLLFGLWCGEEDGFLGSRYFLERPYAPIEDIVACLNMDMIGRLPKSGSGGPQDGKLVVHTSCQTPDLKRIAEESCRLADLEAEFLEDKIEGLAKSGGGRMDSDHVPFAARDIGFIYMETGVHDDWHSFLDHADKINFEGLEKIARAAFLSVRQIAELDSRPFFDKAIPAPKSKNLFKLILVEDPAEKPSTGKAAEPGVRKTIDARPAGEKTKEDTRTIRLTFDLLGKTDDSRFEGTITVSSAGRTIFASDTIILRGFREERTYSREFDVAGLDLAKDGLRWQIKAELSDSALKETFTVMNMDSRTFTKPFRGIGFHISTTGGKLEVKSVTDE